MEKIAINPFYAGNEFMNYCIKQGYITLEFADDKQLHYYLSETGSAELKERFGIVFGCPCSLEQSDE